MHVISVTAKSSSINFDIRRNNCCFDNIDSILQKMLLSSKIIIDRKFFKITKNLTTLLDSIKLPNIPFKKPPFHS